MSSRAKDIVLHKRPPKKTKATWVWDGARALNGIPPNWMRMIPCRTRYKGETTKTTKWIIGFDEYTGLEVLKDNVLEIDGPARKVYDMLFAMRSELQ